MRKRRAFVLAPFSALALACGGAGHGPASAPPPGYEARTIDGFQVLVAKDALAHAKETNDAVALLQAKLDEATRLIDEAHLKPLRNVRFFVEWDKKADDATEYRTKDDVIEVNNPVNFVTWTTKEQPMLVVHELAHAYAHLVLGDENADVAAAYKTALASGKYDEVLFVRGGKAKSVAMESPDEYFAELTEAYFGKNDYFPFSRNELKEHDPDGYALMEKVWGPGGAR